MFLLNGPIKIFFKEFQIFLKKTLYYDIKNQILWKYLKKSTWQNIWKTFGRFSYNKFQEPSKDLLTFVLVLKLILWRSQKELLILTVKVMIMSRYRSCFEPYVTDRYRFRANVTQRYSTWHQRSRPLPNFTVTCVTDRNIVCFEQIFKVLLKKLM